MSPELDHPLTTTATSSSTSPLPTTRARLRSTTGCTTCRRRRIKCDEQKPICANCGKKGRSCQYAQKVSPAAVPGTTATTTDHETRRTRLRDNQPLDFQAVSSSSPSSTTPWVTAPEGPVGQRVEYGLDAVEPAATPHAGGQQAENAIAEDLSTNPFIELESVMLPSLASLGSILLDVDANEDVQLPGLPLVPTQDRPGGHLNEVHLEASEVLRTDTRAQLVGVESVIFRNYVDHVSLWIDSFSRDQPFHRLVPNLALYCPVLLHSCLALLAKQLNLVCLSASYGLQEGDAVHYYRLALNAIGKLLLVDDSARSDELLAACIVLSTYEMLDVVGESLGSHLVGQASLLESRQVYGDADGIRGSCYWTWYRHEVWSALRTGRCLSLDDSYWSPPPLESFHHLQPEDIANRAIFLLGQCVNFCNNHDLESRTPADEWFRSRLARSEYLDKELEDWKMKLPPTMLSYAADEFTAQQRSHAQFGSICFLSPQSAIANQVYHASKILLCLHRVQAQPLVAGVASCSYLSLRQHLEEHRKEILLTANSGISNAWSLVACQCLYIAGMVTEGIPERQRTLDLMEQCQRDSGRKTGYLSADLKKLWAT